VIEVACRAIATQNAPTPTALAAVLTRKGGRRHHRAIDRARDHRFVRRTSSGRAHCPQADPRATLIACARQSRGVAEEITYSWREPVADDEMINLVESHGGIPTVGWWSRVSAWSLGWVSARNQDGLLVGFVNLAWDGGDHGFLVDTRTRGSHWDRS
jgi:hypothetical protein